MSLQQRLNCNCNLNFFLYNVEASFKARSKVDYFIDFIFTKISFFLLNFNFDLSPFLSIVSTIPASCNLFSSCLKQNMDPSFMIWLDTCFTTVPLEHCRNCKIIKLFFFSFSKWKFSLLYFLSIRWLSDLWSKIMSEFNTCSSGKQ